MPDIDNVTTRLREERMTSMEDVTGVIPTVTIAELDQPPEIVRRVTPDVSLLRGLVDVGERVLLRALVDENGKVELTEVARSSGKEVYDRAAKEAVARWRFTPRTSRGSRAKFWTSVSVTFGK